MISLDDLSLSSVEMAYIVANTPSFIVRKFRDDPVVRELAKSSKTSDLKEALRNCLAAAPETMRQLVSPFVFASALNLQGEVQEISDLLSLDASSYPGLREVLIILSRKTKSNTSVTFNIQAKPTILPMPSRGVFSGNVQTTRVRMGGAQ